MTTPSTLTQTVTVLTYILDNLGRNTDSSDVILDFLQYFQTNVDIMLERDQYLLVLIVYDLLFTTV
jgi:hypothetical protein